MNDEQKNSQAASLELSPEEADQLATEFRPSWEPGAPPTEPLEPEPANAARVSATAPLEPEDPLADLELSDEDLEATVVDPPRHVGVEAATLNGASDGNGPANDMLEELLEHDAPISSYPAPASAAVAHRGQRRWGVRTHSTDGPALWRFAAMIAVAGLLIVGSTVAIVRLLRPAEGDRANGPAADLEEMKQGGIGEVALARADLRAETERRPATDGPVLTAAPVVAPPSSVTLELRFTPPDAQARIDGTVYAAGPHQLTPRPEPRRIVVSRRGFVERHIDLVVNEDRSLEIALEQLEQDASGASSATQTHRDARSGRTRRTQRRHRRNRGSQPTMEGIWEAMERATKTTEARSTGRTSRPNDRTGQSGFTRNNPY